MWHYSCLVNNYLEKVSKEREIFKNNAIDQKIYSGNHSDRSWIYVYSFPGAFL